MTIKEINPRLFVSSHVFSLQNWKATKLNR